MDAAEALRTTTAAEAMADLRITVYGGAPGESGGNRILLEWDDGAWLSSSTERRRRVSTAYLWAGLLPETRVLRAFSPITWTVGDAAT